MKQYILLLFFVILCGNAFCQRYEMEAAETGQLVESRFEQLIYTGKYEFLAKKLANGSLIRFETNIYDSMPYHNSNDSNEHFIAKNIVTYKLGKKSKHKLDVYKTLYTIRYAIKEDEIVSITEGDM